jgi:signal peptidase I
MTLTARKLREVLPTIIMLLGVLAFRSSVAEPYEVPTGSMKPTIQPGDFLVVSKLAYDLKVPFTHLTVAKIGAPQRGDVVVFKYPVDPSLNFVKRLIGLPGDHILVKDGTILINGKPLNLSPLDEKHLKMLNATLHEEPRFATAYLETIGSKTHVVQRLDHAEGPIQEFKIPEGQYFFMGDNRDDSNDSRYWGFVPKENLKGKALGVWLSVNLDHGILPEVRWRRIGELL